MNTNEMFYRLNENGNAVILYRESGECVTRIDANVYPVGSDLSTRYEHPEGIVLTVADAEKIGVWSETSIAASAMGKKGGSSRTPKKAASSAANLDRARAEGKKGGYPLGRSRRSREEKEKLLLEKCRRHHLEEMGIGGTLTRRNISEISDSDIDRIYNNIITEIANEPTTRFNPADYLDPEGPIKIYLYDKLFARYSKKGEKFPASDMAKNLAIELMAGCTGRYNVITIGRMEYRLESEK